MALQNYSHGNIEDSLNNYIHNNLVADNIEQCKDVFSCEIGENRFQVVPVVQNIRRLNNIVEENSQKETYTVPVFAKSCKKYDGHHLVEKEPFKHGKRWYHPVSLSVAERFLVNELGGTSNYFNPMTGSLEIFDLERMSEKLILQYVMGKREFSKMDEALLETARILKEEHGKGYEKKLVNSAKYRYFDIRKAKDLHGRVHTKKSVDSFKDFSFVPFEKGNFKFGIIVEA